MREDEELTPERIKAYITLLSDLQHDALEIGLRRAGQECTWFPSVAEIRERSQNISLLAEQGWEEVMRQVRKYGVYRAHYPEAPAFDERTEYALRQAGGYFRVCNMTDKDADFVRKGFLEAHRRFSSEDGQQLRLSQAQAQKTLGTLAALRSAGETKALPAPKQDREPIPFGRPAPRQLTPEEHEARMQQLRQQAASLGVGKDG